MRCLKRELAFDYSPCVRGFGMICLKRLLWLASSCYCASSQRLFNLFIMFFLDGLTSHVVMFNHFILQTVASLCNFKLAPTSETAA